jgi:hypothetical protein
MLSTVLINDIQRRKRAREVLYILLRIFSANRPLCPFVLNFDESETLQSDTNVHCASLLALFL